MLYGNDEIHGTVNKIVPPIILGCDLFLMIYHFVKIKSLEREAQALSLWSLFLLITNVAVVICFLVIAFDFFDSNVISCEIQVFVSADLYYCYVSTFVYVFCLLLCVLHGSVCFVWYIFAKMRKKNTKRQTTKQQYQNIFFICFYWFD